MGEKKLANRLQSIELSDSQTPPVAMIRPHDAAAEKPLERLQDLLVPLVLNHDELRQYLVAAGHFLVPVEADMKTAFPVDKSYNPIRGKFHSGLAKEIGYSACSL